MSNKRIHIESELKQFLKDYPKTQFVDILIADNYGILRGKRIYRDKMEPAITKGIRMSATIFSIDTTGESVYIKGIPWLVADCDMHCKAVVGTLSPMPWHKTPSAQVLMSMFEEDGTPFYADSRHRLSKIISLLKEIKLTPVTSVEMEFYLIDADETTRSGVPIPPKKGKGKKSDYSISLYSVDDIDEYGDFINEVIKTAAIQNVNADKAISEESPGQFEINLYHLDNPLKACDEAILLKRIIRQTAKKYNMKATFMAKPYQHFAGNGMHIHISVLDENRKNIFDGNIEKQGLMMSETMLHALGGLQSLMAESVLLFAPNLNSYRRYASTSLVANSTSWGVNNRTVALRIPSGLTEEIRVEHRIAGADANPYLVMSAILAGIYHGIVHKIKPTEPIEGNALEQVESNIPTNWINAIDAFKNGKNLPKYLGQDFSDIFLKCRQAEYDRSSNQIHPIEYDWYLDSV